VWVLLFIGHLAGQVGSQLLIRRHLGNDIDPWLLATVLQTGAAIPLLFALPFFPLDVSRYHPSAWGLLAVISILVIIFNWTNVKALQYLEAGIFSIFFNLRIVLVTILGILFLAEPVIPLQVAGGLLIFLAVLALSRMRDSVHFKGLAWGLAAATVVSVVAVIEKHLITSIGYMQYMVPSILASTAVMWGILIFRHAHVPWRAVATPDMAKLMTFRALAVYGFTLAMAVGAPVSVGTYISSLGVIVTVLIGAWWLGERDHMKQKLAATAIAVVGLTAIMLSNLTT
jgi:hypothetical protein